MDLTFKVDKDDLVKDSSKYKNIFFYRICGTGMGATACLLKEYGLNVEGADHTFYPPMSTYLESSGIPCHKISDLNEEFYKKFDLIVVGNVVPRNSDDARMLEGLGIPFCSFPAAIGALALKGKHVLGLSGTHGKTTSTFFATQLFENLGVDPGYLIGGVMEGRSSSRIGRDKYFFIESDEYDSAYFEKFSKFHSYFIDDLVITSLEFDHADIFESIEDIEAEFSKLLVSNVKRVFACEEYESILKITKDFQTKFLYGNKSSIGPHIIEETKDGSVFKINYKNKELEFKTNVVGVHNIYNLTPLILFALEEGFDYEQISKALSNLGLVKRRQEYRGLYKDSIVIDDFAHHPRAVKLTIDAIKKRYPHKKINVIIDPVSATARSSIFQREFEESLYEADSVACANLNKPTTVKWAGNLDFDLMARNLNAKEIEATVASNLEELMSYIDSKASEDSVILVLSNGTCLGLWESDFVKALI